MSRAVEPEGRATEERGIQELGEIGNDLLVRAVNLCKDS